MSERVRRPALGRGLAALFGEAAPGAADMGAPQRVAIELIRPGMMQPRRHFPEDDLAALAQSIREKGILQPLLVRPVEDGAAHYELVAGERRWRAAQRAGLHEVPVVVRALGDAEALEIALVENLQRADLSALDEAEAYHRLVQEFGHTQAQIAAAVGKSRSHVANTVRLLSLPEAVRQRLAAGELTAGHARALLAAPDPAGLAETIVRRGLNVRTAERLAQQGAPAPREPRPPDPNTAALERDLAAALGLKVTIAANPRGGSLTLHYRSLDQLDEVLRRLRAER
jgi:ParB family transcriptional regulator, chromosome partitioning protein